MFEPIIDAEERILSNNLIVALVGFD